MYVDLIITFLLKYTIVMHSSVTNSLPYIQRSFFLTCTHYSSEKLFFKYFSIKKSNVIKQLNYENKYLYGSLIETKKKKKIPKKVRGLIIYKGLCR